MGKLKKKEERDNESQSAEVASLLVTRLIPLTGKNEREQVNRGAGCVGSRLVDALSSPLHSSSDLADQTPNKTPRKTSIKRYFMLCEFSDICKA